MSREKKIAFTDSFDVSILSSEKEKNANGSDLEKNTKIKNQEVKTT